MNAKTIATIAIATNIVLAGAVVFLVTRRPSATYPRSNANAAAPAANISSASTPASVKRSVITITQTTTNQIDWRMVESADYKQYIANLRAIGCPEETIRDIIKADVNKLFASRAQADRGPKKKYEYWKAGTSMLPDFDEKNVERAQKLAAEKRALLKELLGVEVEEPPKMFEVGMDFFNSMLDFLPPDKQRQVMEVEEKFAARQMKLFKPGEDAEDSMAALKKLQEEKKAEWAKFMTPQEIEDYQLRMSPLAMTMRMGLGSFEPKEQEFRDIFRIREKYEGDMGFISYGESADGGTGGKTADKQKQMDDELKKLLGDSRYAEYKRSQDYDFQNLSAIAEKNSLPKDTAIKAYEINQAASDETRKLTADKSLTNEQRNSALQAVTMETEKALREALGEAGFKAYKKRQTGTVAPPAVEVRTDQ